MGVAVPDDPLAELLLQSSQAQALMEAMTPLMDPIDVPVHDDQELGQHKGADNLPHSTSPLWSSRGLPASYPPASLFENMLSLATNAARSQIRAEAGRLSARLQGMSPTGSRAWLQAPRRAANAGGGRTALGHRHQSQSWSSEARAYPSRPVHTIPSGLHPIPCHGSPSTRPSFALWKLRG